MSVPDRAEAARELLEHADGDLRAVEALAADESQADHVIGLSAQQAVEKALKAVLVTLDAEIPRTHDLAYLVRVVLKAGGSPPAALADSDWLSPWAGAWRYEESDDSLDRVAAVDTARVALTWAHDQLRDLG